MPVKNYLKKEEKEKLQSELKYNDHPDIRGRILILLLQNDGKTQQEIADFIGCSLTGQWEVLDAGKWRKENRTSDTKECRYVRNWLI